MKCVKTRLVLFLDKNGGRYWTKLWTNGQMDSKNQKFLGTGLDPGQGILLVLTVHLSNCPVVLSKHHPHKNDISFSSITPPDGGRYWTKLWTNGQLDSKNPNFFKTGLESVLKYFWF